MRLTRWGVRPHLPSPCFATACPPLYRFDRELVFPLPNLSARADILHIHTRKWAEPPAPQLLQELASLCVGYCGADLKVCASSVWLSRRRMGQGCLGE